MNHLYLTELANDRQAELRKVAAKHRLIREIEAANKAYAVSPNAKAPRPRRPRLAFFATPRALGRWVLVGRRLV